VDDLADIQRAINELDQLPASTNHGGKNSNFERSLSIRDLAGAYKMVGKLDQGIQLFLSALHRISQTRGGQCLEAAWLHNSIGILYDQQDLTELAASTQLRALEIQQKHLPPDHKCVEHDPDVSLA
jgi:tetratricopeptide (TPR) repeat protein